MTKAILELDIKQIEGLVESLPLKDKITIAQRLTVETWQARFSNLISRIDKRLKRRRVLSDERIVALVKKIRKHNYAQSHH